jgi:hypothetical protein
MAVAPRRTNEWTLWVVAVSCALHAVEEYLTGWQEWAAETLGIVMPTSLFFAANAVLVACALLFARVGWRRPTLSLVVPAATLVNAIVFHILPTVVQGRVSPGVYTAALLYLPFSSWALLGARRDGVTMRAIAAAVVGGILVMSGFVSGARWLGQRTVKPNRRPVALSREPPEFNRAASTRTPTFFTVRAAATKVTIPRSPRKLGKKMVSSVLRDSLM